MIERVISKMTRAEVFSAMSEVGIPAGPINSVSEILEDPQIHAREMVQHLTHPEYGPLKVLGIPIKLSETPGVVENAPPKFGEHNREVLAAIGYDAEEIAGLIKGGTISS
jgi:crotonobetainyl-CoA:carnitine CoA-transferase CaiB-like acyl-CoA transferase